MNVDLRHGDCVELMRGMPENSVDSIVTDPPYELSFMGRKWDGSGIAYSVEMWAEALRVLKPGGHLLAFGGTRTYHRMACAIEDAGFEIRDSIHWVYGSGFPKSLNIGKAIDKAAGAEREVIGTRTLYGTAASTNPVVGAMEGVSGVGASRDVPVTVAATDEARRWEGWGTALKPAHEPIVVARKPLAGTVAGNVLVWGTGGLNIDGCRVGTTVETWPASRSFAAGISAGYTDGLTKGATQATGDAPAGRWPANVVFDRTAGEALDQQSGVSASNVRVSEDKDAAANTWALGRTGTTPRGHLDSGGASRFFTQADFGPDDWPFVYQAKPSRKERNAGLDGLPEKDVHRYGAGIGEGKDPNAPARDGNHHPTVKPVALMRHLVRLVTPPGGTVLDPFAGSGTTLVAAVLEGFDAIGCEMTDEYLPIIEGRVAWAQEQAFIREELDKLTPKQERLL
jgi:site-specific DNA-methyltransferase (adenine-specific)